MKLEKVYPPFAKKIDENLKQQLRKSLDIRISDSDQKYRTLISFDDNAKRLAFMSKNQNIEIIKKFDIIPSILTKLSKNQVLEASENSLIKRIEEDQKLYLSILEVSQIIGFNNYKRSSSPLTGSNIKIGIIDDGINQSFESIKESIVGKYQLSPNKDKPKNTDEDQAINHGTLMAALMINKSHDQQNRIIGIAPEAKVIDFDISNDNSEFFISDVLEIFDLIIKKSIIIDLLLIPLNSLYPSDGNDILSLACNLLVEKGIIIISPAGNFGPESYTIGTPAAAEKVITIGSLTKKKTVAYYSGRGPTLDNRMKPNFCIPGSKVAIPLSHDKIISLSGTSVSAAIGTAIIALLKEFKYDIDCKEILTILENGCHNLNYDPISQGVGMINFADIFKQLFDYPSRQKSLSYNQIIKKSIRISVETLLMLIIIYYIINFFNIIRLITHFI
jgi:serine protease AprX